MLKISRIALAGENINIFSLQVSEIVEADCLVVQTANGKEVNVSVRKLARYPQDQVDRSADAVRETLAVSEESRVDSNGSLHSRFHYNESAAEVEQYIPQDEYINESLFNDQHVLNSDNNEEPLLKRSERKKKPPKYLDDYEWERGECYDIG
ncbi:hypothetical protein GJ496_009099 [Pomphorhynchus laevis]|nr:hypothetical protein GJ496_009099 [Pomphorhynchus laevis]